LSQSFSGRDENLLQSTERHAAIILDIAGSQADLDRYCDDYRF